MVPTRRASLVYAAKRAALQARRALRDAAAKPPRLARATQAGTPAAGAPVATSRTPLWSDEALAERAMQAGKVQNLRIACQALDRRLIPAGATFSVWRHLGPPTRARGYVPGRMLQQGCMVRSTGGGLCQLSNALYDVALQADCTILERHPHSRPVPGSAAAEGRDATLAWNDVDLRFTPTQDLVLTTSLDRNHLTVSLRSPLPPSQHPPSWSAQAGHPRLREPQAPPLVADDTAHSCATCNETACHRHEPPATRPNARRLVLLDETWPEFLTHIETTRTPGDVTAHNRTAPLAALRRSLALRRAATPPARRAAELHATARLARALAHLLTPETTHVTIAQSYLPALWATGLLAARTITVLMTRLPMLELHARLDAAAAAHPGRPTLADFRAPPAAAALEAEALAAADHILTPHADIAALFGARATLLPWRRPTPPAHTPGDMIVFPGPTIARKGAHAVRGAAQALGLTVMPLGAPLEHPAFWQGIRTVPPGPWTGVAALVQPAIVEHAPRRLLAALAAGIPVLASPACGLPPQPGLTLIPPGDTQALIAALQDLGLARGRAGTRCAESEAPLDAARRGPSSTGAHKGRAG